MSESNRSARTGQGPDRPYRNEGEPRHTGTDLRAGLSATQRRGRGPRAPNRRDGGPENESHRGPGRLGGQLPHRRSSGPGVGGRVARIAG